jgi:TrkA domain protein
MRDTVTECDLPGIGRKYTFTAEGGEQLAIVVHQTGTRELFIFPRGAEEPCGVIAFEDDEARQIGAIISGAYYKPKILEDLEVNLQGIAIEWFRIGSAAPARGKSIGELQIRKRTGVSIIDIIRGGQSLPNPGPETVLDEGDTLVVAAKHGQLAAFRELVTGRGSGKPMP